jgi:MerR family transcriptional regulator/heat shock protein HspR
MLRRPRQPASSRPRAERNAEPDRAATTTVEDRQAEAERPGRDPGRPVYVISVAAGLVAVHPRTLRIYEGEGLICPARTPSNIRLYSENDIRRVLWIRHLTQNLGVNLAGVRVLFELEERLGMRILEQLYSEGPITRSAPGEDPDAAGTSR